jgi:PncC family amidohydrolase
VSDLLFQLLKKKQMTMSAAESCTGGLISKNMTDIAGSSDVFWGGFITYSNDAKKKLLAVDECILDSYGAVSRETVIAMAEGAIGKSGTDCTVSVSGIAGPGGGSELKPVGTVWICAALSNGIMNVDKYLFQGNRNEVREKATETAIMMVYHLICEYKLLTVNK